MLTLHDLCFRLHGHGHGFTEGDVPPEILRVGPSFYRTPVGNRRCERVALICQHQLSFFFDVINSDVIHVSYYVVSRA